LSAIQQINILTGKLHVPVYGNLKVIDAAVKFFEAHPAGRIRILSETPISPDHPFLSALAAMRDRIDLRVMSAETEKRTPFHLAVADKRSFRFEHNKHKYEAYAQFGEPRTGEKLTAAFDRLHSLAPTG
jgi:hypothetical protein